MTTVKKTALIIAALGVAAAGFAVTAPAASAKVCDGTSVACAIGDTGPGGGIVFYDAGSKKKWGRYLEAAPPAWAGENPDPVQAWCPSGGTYATVLPTKTAIGTGRKNTGVIIKACGAETSAGRAAAFTGGGKSDWFLPSTDELNQMPKHAKILGTSSSDSYWSSSQAKRAVSACSLFIPDGYQDCGNEKSNAYFVRPVRSF